ncbi:MAG TPA: transglutaminase domain-containing protein, partial [Ignavibacteria bacterium]|nr:transglutaminase domain-containing protein [Ignavibacteria bacterium]
MNRYIYLAIFYLTGTFLLIGSSFGQVIEREPDERLLKISDSLRDSTRNNPKKYLPILTKELLANINDDFEKVKIIHDWITTEIEYDNEIQLRRSDLIRDTYDVLKTKRAICVGYCNLFSEMCSYAGFETVAINGVAKNSFENEYTLPVNFPGSNHQWNAVKIHGKWYFVDITWNAGYSYKRSFTFRYSTTYLFTEPQDFIKNHFPEKEQWQLLEKPVTWSEFRGLTFIDPVKKLSLNKYTLKGGINFSRMYNLYIPEMNESKGFNISFSMIKGITNELGFETELSYDHSQINQDLSSLLPSPYINTESNNYIDPNTNEQVTLGNFGMEKIGVGVNLKYHLVNETVLLPFLKTGFSIAAPFSFNSGQRGMIVRKDEGTEVVRVKNFGFPEQLLYGVLISTGADLISREGGKMNYQPVLGIELKWSFTLNSLELFENYQG